MGKVFIYNQRTKLTCLEITALRLVISAHKGTNASINGSPGTTSKEPIEKWTRAPNISIWYMCKVKHIPFFLNPSSIINIWCFKNTTPKITFICSKVATHEFPYYPLKKQMPLAGYFCHIMWPIHCREIWPKRWQIKLHARTFRSFRIHSHPIGFLVPREKTHILLG